MDTAASLGMVGGAFALAGCNSRSVGGSTAVARTVAIYLPRVPALIFDAEEFGVTRPTDPALANGFLIPSEIGGQNVVALYSAYHGEIGEPAYIHEIEDSLASVTYVHNAGDRWRGSEATVYLSPHDQTSVGDIEVVTVPVTETMTSLGYLVKVDGLVVYYAGFRAEDVEKFEPEIDFLAAQTDHIDLAFLQWVGPDEDDNEVRQFVERFDPRAVLVLSPDRREGLFPEMTDRLQAWGFEGEIFTAANAGDEFVFLLSGPPPVQGVTGVLFLP